MPEPTNLGNLGTLTAGDVDLDIRGNARVDLSNARSVAITGYHPPTGHDGQWDNDWGQVGKGLGIAALVVLAVIGLVFLFSNHRPYFGTGWSGSGWEGYRSPLRWEDVN